MSANCTTLNAGYETAIAEAVILWARDANATVSARNTGLARKSVEEALGLRQARAEETGIRIYESDCTISNKSTPISWAVGNEIDDVLQALQSF